MADEKPKGKPSPTQERQEKKRAESKAEFQRQVDEGSVVIRKMTKKERAANPPKERQKKR
jgi:hypothetical protein